MPFAGLIDTGAILAILEMDDGWHRVCLEALRSAPLPLLTTEAVLTETFHLTGKTAHDRERAWRFVRSGALSVRSLGDSDLPALHALMTQYKDRPMDFADATLVHLAARESLSLILTVDHDDFEAYRIAGRKRFTILPGRKRK
ncbi:MAG: type II toxin-antitoxin system VapC family toxin [Terriglobales bacterium]|jgi:predicted nucleic acid-binding protein